MARFIQQRGSIWQARPVRRAFIPKAGGRRRSPLGIPVIVDRCHPARMSAAPEPEWEARFGARSYGFRPGRGCHDAIGVIHNTLNGKNPRRVWIPDADLAAAFDRIDHDRLLAQLGTFPARAMVRQWLKAGVIERFCPAGTCRIQPADSPIRAAGSSTGTPRRYAARTTRSRRARHRSRATRPPPGGATPAVRSSSRPVTSSTRRCTQSPSRRRRPR
ncbi:reverse transcriptase domain-containing protein [Streptomyces monashensis]|uniref:reverse transcriptase domain-containing protein n=1 Tax=Streptomyces monashensis TaxID=1678012 RepID=UPI003183D92E